MTNSIKKARERDADILSWIRSQYAIWGMAEIDRIVRKSGYSLSQVRLSIKRLIVDGKVSRAKRGFVEPEDDPS